MLPIVILLGTAQRPQRERLLHGSSNRRGDLLRLFCDVMHHRLGLLDLTSLLGVELANGSKRKGLGGPYSCDRRVVSSAAIFGDRHCFLHIVIANNMPQSIHRNHRQNPIRQEPQQHRRLPLRNRRGRNLVNVRAWSRNDCSELCCTSPVVPQTTALFGLHVIRRPIERGLEPQGRFHWRNKT